MALVLLKAIGAPGSLTLLALCLAAGLTVTYIWPRNRRLGHAWLACVYVGYGFLGLPCVANAIADRLSRLQLTVPVLPRPLDRLVVFDGDNRRGRVREALRAYQLGSPAVVWALGDKWMVGALIEAGIPSDRIVLDDTTPTTRDQMARVQRLLLDKPAASVAVIVSRLQIPRVAALARASHLRVTIIGSPIDTEPPTEGLRRFVPSYTALRVSRDALYEHIALVYYRWQKWIA